MFACLVVAFRIKRFAADELGTRQKKLPVQSGTASIGSRDLPWHQVWGGNRTGSEDFGRSKIVFAL
jgi:hypothetical protein